MRKMGMAAVAGLVALLLGGQQARAQDDTVRLGGSIESKTTTLAFDGQSETTLMRGVRGFVGGRGGVGYSHVGHYGHVGNYGHVGHYGNVGLYRTNYSSYGYRPYYSSYGYRPYYSTYSYGQYYNSYYGNSYYGNGYGYGYGYPAYYPSYSYCAPYYGASYGYYPIAGDVQVGVQPAYRPAVTVIPTQPQPYNPTQIPMPPADGGTYPYDGGPVNPIPLPKNPGGVYQPGTPVVGDGRIVGLPANQKATSGSGFAYPAYGDNSAPTTFATSRFGVAPGAK